MSEAKAHGNVVFQSENFSYADMACEYCGDMTWSHERYGRAVHKKDCPRYEKGDMSQEAILTDSLVYRHVINTHSGAALVACPFCRFHIFEFRKGIIPRPHEGG